MRDGGRSRSVTDSDPTRVVVDADVLAADVLVGGPAREVLDHVRAHDWLTLPASDALLADARAVIASIADERLAGDWRDRIEDERTAVEHAAGDHPALASAVAGNAAHLVTFDGRLTGPQAGVALRQYSISVRTPTAFASVFDPAALYETMVGEEYAGPDRDPRA